jgi:hypothetical protein
MERSNRVSELKVGATWAKQIESIRLAHSDATNIQRSNFENYRTCRNSSALFTINLSAGTGNSAALGLQVRENNFYILKLGSHPMERYSSMLKTDEQSRQKFQISQWRVDSAIHDLVRNINQKAQFENLTLLTFCVAESLRCETLAREIAATMKSGGSMDIQDWVPWVKDWEATSAAIRANARIREDRRVYAAGISVLCL